MNDETSLSQTQSNRASVAEVLGRKKRLEDYPAAMWALLRTLTAGPTPASQSNIT